MYRETVSAGQLGAWLVALSPVMVQLAAMGSWKSAGAISVICILVVLAVWRWGCFERWVCIGAYILLMIAGGQLMRQSAVMWRGRSDPWVPLLLLGLALWSALKGAKAAAGVGCVLFWAVVILYPLIYGAAVRDIQWRWVLEDQDKFPAELGVALLLLGLGKVLMKERRIPKAGVLPGLIGVLGAVLTAGLGCVDFYELTESIDLGGAVKHFEPVVFAAAMLGWFLFLSYCLSLFGGLGEGKVSVVMGALVMAAWMLCDMHIQYNLLLLYGAIFWGALPVLAQFVGCQKKMEKSEKTP